MIEESFERDLECLLNIVPYIPFNILNKLNTSEYDIFNRQLEVMEGTIIFVDIVQFVPLVFSCIKDGNQGVEDVNTILSEYYTQLINPIRQLGGTVYQFAGDSILVGFNKLANESSLENINRALSSMSEFFMNLELFNRDFMPKFNRVIEVRVGISFGFYYQILIGSKEFSYSSVITGDAVRQAVVAESNSDPDTISVHSSILNIKELDATKKSSEIYTLKETYFESVDYDVFLNIPQCLENPEFFNMCSMFINPGVYQRVLTGYEILTAEHREVTSLLLKFDGINYNDDLKDFVEKLDSFFNFVQHEADRYGGVLLAPDLSDKGNVFVILFGAPVALERKELAAVQFSLSLQKAYKSFNFIKKIQFGIATGRAYCGDFGSSIRKEYSLVGGVVNLSARLMEFSTESGIFLDERTTQRLGNGYNVKSSGDVLLKGMRHRINVFELLESTDIFKITHFKNSGLKIIGRDKELETLFSKFKAAENGHGNCCGVVADAGIGKSLLVNTFLSKIDITNTKIITGCCFSYEKNTLYYLWRDLFSNFFDIPAIGDKEKMTSSIKEIFNSYIPVDMEVWIPVLLRMLGVDVEESEETKTILVEQKQKILFDIVFKIVESFSKDKNLLIYIEDLHWIDEKSFLLFNYIVRKIENIPIFMVFTSRNSTHKALLNDLPYFCLLNVNSLDIEDAKKLIRSNLKFRIPNTLLEEQIIKASECNPFFIDSIIQGIKDSKKILCDNTGTFFLNGAIEDIAIPNSIKSVILSRIDLLDSKEKAVIKTASVIGHNFSYVLLASMLSDDLGNDINSSLENLEAYNLMNKDEFDPMGYRFKHASIRDVIYQTLLHGTKTKLNLLLATHIEESAGDNVYGYCERLALHYKYGEDYKKALEYTIMSAEKAKGQYANNDVIKHYKNAIKLCNLVNCGSTMFHIKQQLAQTYRVVGQYLMALDIFNDNLQSQNDVQIKAVVLKDIGHTYQELGDITRALNSCEDGLKLLGRRVPNNLFLTILFIVKQLIMRGLNNTWFIKKIINKLINNSSFEDQIEILKILDKIYFFSLIQKTLWASAFQYNLSEYVDNPRYLSLAATDYGIVMVSSGLKKLGFKHLSRGLLIADEISIPSVRAVCLSRMSLYYLFHNNPNKSIDILNEAIGINRTIGEMWELMTALGTLGQNYYNIGEYQKSRNSYLELFDISHNLNSLSHQGWMYCKVPFIDYLLGNVTYLEAVGQMNEGIYISDKARDLMNLCVIYGHMVEMAIISGDKNDVAKMVLSTIKYNREYVADLPHIRISLISACEGAVYAAENGANILSRNEFLTIAKKMIKWIKRLSKQYSSLLGPTYRVVSIYELAIGDIEKSKKTALLSMSYLKESLYKREYALALKQGAKCFPKQREVYLQEAKDIFLELKLKREFESS